MSSGKFIIGGVFIIAAIAGSIPLFFHDYKRFSNSNSTTPSAVSIPKSLDFSQNFSADSLGTYSNTILKRSELSSQERQSLFDAESKVYTIVEELLAKRYFDNVIKDYMKKKNIASLSTAQQMFLEEIQTVSPEEIKSFITQNADHPRLKGKPFNEQAAMVRNYLSEEKRNTYFKNFIADASAKGIIEVTGMPKPFQPKVKIDVGNSPSRGANDAPITIVEFADFQCPFCANANKVVEEILKEYKGKVRFVFKNFPITQIHPEAMNSAIAAECAYQQNKYWQMHEALFANNTKLGPALYNKIAQNIGLNLNEFNKCKNDSSVKEKIVSEIEYGQKLGINATPAFYINGTQLMGAQPKIEFDQIIKKELAAKN
ncbi:DsbA family protein [Fluviispira vulneris]|uniref:DsbA family protein n=1 Tax=Fluviispira vulneris TaxID=2763012 RepID=UPI00164705F9|nr:DsbA family protein [Fluviispira vulneris]